jgi:uncharacterized membrane protein YphA (DoxX/SURF4 family)
VPDVLPNNPCAALKLWQRPGAVPWVVVVARVVVGGVFIVAGFSKLWLPHAEVAAHIQQYPFIPEALIPLIATLLPWVELASGTALCIGFYTTPAALLVGAQLLGFSLLMLVVLVTGVSLEDCGCFGNLGLNETPLQVLIRDLVMLALLVPVLTRQRDVLALDAWNDVSASG